jgi:hypothetical protein
MNFFKSVGHWFASILPTIVKVEKQAAPAIQKAASALGQLGASAATVEGLTALLGPNAGQFVSVEKAIYGAFGLGHDLLSALGTAATSGSVITLSTAGTSTTFTIDPALAQSILDAGNYLKAHPFAGDAPVIGPKA